MGETIGTFSIEVTPDTSKFQSTLKRNLDSVGKSMQKVGAGLTVGLTAPIAAFTKQSIDAASDLGESLNAVNKIFGDSAKEIHDWGKTNATSFGLSQRAFNDLAVPLGAMLKNSGIAMSDVTDRTIDLTERAADMASVFNTDVDEALMAIQAGLRGEADPLERFGVGLNAAAVEARALADTGKASAEALTDQEKMLARVNLILEQTNDTAGDFNDTSDGLANSQRILAAEWETIQSKLGAVLLPLMTDLAARVRTVTEALSGMTDGQARTIVQITGVVAAIGPATVALGTFLRALSSIGLLLTPGGAVLAALGGLGAAIGAALSNQDFRGQVAGMLGAIQRAFERGDYAAIGRVLRQGVTDGIDAALSAAGGAAGTVVTALFGDSDVGKALARHLERGDWASAGRVFFFGVQQALEGVNWQQLGSTLGNALVSAVGAITGIGGRIGRTLVRVIGDIDWLALGKAAGPALIGFVLGLIDALTDPAVWYQALIADGRWKTTLSLLVGVMFAPSRIVSPIAKALRKIPLAGRFLAWAVEGLNRFGSQVTGFLGRVFGRVGRAIGSEIDDLGPGIIRRFAEWLGRLPSVVAAWALNVQKAFFRAGGRMLDGLGKGIGKAIRPVLVGLRRFGDNIIAVFRNAGSWLVRHGRNLLDGLWSGISGFWARTIRPWFNALRALISRTLGSTVRTLLKQGGDFLRGLWSGISGFWTRTVRPWFQGLRSLISRTLGSTVRTLLSQGSDLIKGLRSGITSGMSGIKDFLKRTVWNPIVTGVKALFGINSPSTVFAGFGRDMIRGLIQGLVQNNPAAFVRKVFGGVSNAAMKALGFLFDGGQIDITQLFKLPSELMGKLLGALGLGGLGSKGGLGGYQAMFAAVKAIFPFVDLISGFRPGAITATGNPSYHGMGRAIDINPNPLIFEWIRRTFGAVTKELIFSPMGSRQIWNGRPHLYSGITKAMHWDHIHWAMAKGGQIGTRLDMSGADDVLARLTRGEWVMPVRAVTKYGPDFMRDVQTGRLPQFAAGGPVGRWATSSYRDALEGMLRRLRSGNRFHEDFSFSGMGRNVRRHRGAIADRFYAAHRGFDFRDNQRTRQTIAKALRGFLGLSKKMAAGWVNNKGTSDRDWRALFRGGWRQILRDDADRLWQPRLRRIIADGSVLRSQVTAAQWKGLARLGWRPDLIKDREVYGRDRNAVHRPEKWEPGREGLARNLFKQYGVPLWFGSAQTPAGRLESLADQLAQRGGYRKVRARLRKLRDRLAKGWFTRQQVSSDDWKDLLTAGWKPVGRDFASRVYHPGLRKRMLDGRVWRKGVSKEQFAGLKRLGWRVDRKGKGRGSLVPPRGWRLTGKPAKGADRVSVVFTPDKVRNVIAKAGVPAQYDLGPRQSVQDRARSITDRLRTGKLRWHTFRRDVEKMREEVRDGIVAKTEVSERKWKSLQDRVRWQTVPDDRAERLYRPRVAAAVRRGHVEWGDLPRAEWNGLRALGWRRIADRELALFGRRRRALFPPAAWRITPQQVTPTRIDLRDALPTVERFATGGRVDDILARLTRGEWVMPVAAVSKYGAGFMRDIQTRRLPEYHAGGPVGLTAALGRERSQQTAAGTVVVRNEIGGRVVSEVIVDTVRGEVRRRGGGDVQRAFGRSR